MLRFFALSIVALVFMGTASFAQNARLSISDLINQGQFELARQVMTKAEASPLEWAFFEGQMAKATGDLARAITIFRQITKKAPGFLDAQRELAHSLMLAGRFTAASLRFNRLLIVDESAEMKNGYRRFLNLISDKRPLEFFLDFAILPSNNVNRGSFRKTVPGIGRFSQGKISDEDRAKTGTGLRTGLAAELRLPMSSQTKLVLRYGKSKTRYEDDTFNALVEDGSARVEYAGANYHIGIGPYRYEVDRTDTPESSSIKDVSAKGMLLFFALNPIPSERLQFTFRREERDYYEHDYLNGPFARGELRYTKALGHNLSLTGSIAIERSHPQSDQERYDGQSYGIELRKTWENGLQLGLNFLGGWRSYDADHSSTAYPRKDDFAKLGFDLLYSKLQFLGFSPKLSCSHMDTYSNIAFFDNVVDECTISATRRF